MSVIGTLIAVAPYLLDRIDLLIARLGTDVQFSNVLVGMTVMVGMLALPIVLLVVAANVVRYILRREELYGRMETLMADAKEIKEYLGLEGEE